MIALLLATAAAQDLPDRLALTLSEGTGIDAVVSHEDDEWVAWLETSTNQVRVLDGQTWEVTAVAVCTSHGSGPAGLAVYPDPDTLQPALYVGCADGTVERIALDDRAPVLDSDGELGVSGQPILGLAGDSDGLVIAVEPEDGTGVDLHAWDPGGDDTSDPTVAFATPTRDGFEALGLTSTSVLLLHGGQYVTEVTRSSGAALPADTIGVSRDWIDVTGDGANEICLADTDGVVGAYSVGQNEVTSILGASQGLGGLSALVLQPAGDDPYLAVAESDTDELVLFAFTGTTVSTQVVATLTGAEAVHRMAILDDVLAAGTTDGRVLLFTDDPWVTISAAPTTTLVSGDAEAIRFSADQAGDWTLRVGGRTGTTLASGTVAAGETATASFVVDDSFAEGDNRLFVVVDDGHDAVDVTVDDPPGAVDLQADDISFGNQSLTVAFDALSDGDIATYDLYFTTTAFTADEWPTGGPTFTEGDLESPVSGSGDAAGTVTVTLSPLTNETTYYVAVRAIDTSGQEGPMSTVYDATPEPISGAADLASEQGGFTACGTAGGQGGGLALLLAGLLALGRRRTVVPVLAGVLGLAWSAPAQALPPLLDLGVDEHDRKSQAVSLDAGPAWFADPSLTDVYGAEGVRDLRLGRDWQWYRILGAGVSLGLMSDKGEQVGVTTGTSSGEIAKLKVVPIRLGGTLRLDLFDGQPVVPMVTLGLDYLVWWETTSFNTTDPFSSERLGGGKPAWDWGIGFDVLLDGFEPIRAEGALARWGVYDTYVTVRYEQLRLLPGPAISDQGLDFGHSGVSLGLRLDR